MLKTTPAYGDFKRLVILEVVEVLYSNIVKIYAEAD